MYNVAGTWLAQYDAAGIVGGGGQMEYTRLVTAFTFNDGGTGTWYKFMLNNESADPIAIDGGEGHGDFTYSVGEDGSITCKLKWNEAPTYYPSTFALAVSDSIISGHEGDISYEMTKASDGMKEWITDWADKLTGGGNATADNYNINDVDFTPDTWRDQESIYIYDGTGTDETDAKGRTGYTLVNMPWYEGDKLTNLPYGFNTGNDHVWQISMTDHLANNSVWEYGLPLDRNISNKATLGQNGSGTYMEYVTPWVDYMSQDGLIVPNAGWWAFDVDLSMARADGIQPSDNIKLQMRSWNTQHVSLASTVAANIDGTFKGQFDITKTTVSSAKGLTQSLSDIAGVGKSLYSAVSSAIKGNYLDALKNAVSFGTGAYNVYGAMTKKTTTSVDTIGKGSITGTINLGLTGNIDTEGTIKGSAPTVGIASPTFYLKDFDLKNSHLGQGVWNLKTPPVVYVLCRFDTFGTEKFYPYFFDPNSIDIQLNPDVFPESQVEWIKEEALCTAKKSKMNDDATRLAYGLVSYGKIPESAIWVNQSDRFSFGSYAEGIQWIRNITEGDNSFRDFLYSSEDKMGFELKDVKETRVLRGRCKDDVWLEPYVEFYNYDQERMPFLEVNVTVCVKMKGMDTPILLSRNYLPEYKNYDYGWGMDQAIQKTSAYKHSELYNYQMKRINDLLTLFRVPSYKDYNYIPLSGTGGTGSEGYDKLFDGKKETKWCTESYYKKDGKWFVEFMSKEPIKRSEHHSFCMTTANDTRQFPGRNPKKWQLYGKLNQGDKWTELKSGGYDAGSWDPYKLSTENYMECCYDWFGPSDGIYQYFRLEILEVESGDVMQLSEFYIY